ncbi:MAG TPA: ion channel [Thermoanaerobaculia bacterium]|jgi:inward rectifier potassium channel|nr:ion channel [Thermoanaerobaculia bacterium]
MSALDERRPLPAAKTGDVNADLGFGSVVTRELRQRFLNRDGTFNVRREGLGFWESLSAYHYLLSIGWPTFLGYVTVGYVVLNALFAFAYVACGPRALAGFLGATAEQRFFTAFFFSVHTLATIGYGNIVPLSMAANIIVTIESLAGLLGFGVVAGIAFARFARPMANILFSRNAIIAPYGDQTALMFRIVNQKSNQIVNLEATVMLSRRKSGSTTPAREFIPLPLEREGVTFFPLSWTIVHPIDEKSPFHGETEEMFRTCDAEVLIMLNGFDETFSQTVHTRSSYKGDEVVWGAKFRSMFNPPRDDGVLSVDIRHLSEFDRVALR